MVETATTTTITRTSSSASPSNVGPPATPTAALVHRNDETTRGIYNLKIIVFLLFLPFVLFAVLLKHLLDYLFALGLKEKDVSGKVALVRLGGHSIEIADDIIFCMYIVSKFSVCLT